MPLEVEDSPAQGTQRIYARLAGCLFLAVIAIAFGGSFIAPHIPGNATFAEAARVVAGSGRAYRVSLSLQLIVTLSSILLAFALYATLKPVNSFLAQLAMIFFLEDTFLQWLVWMCSFVRLDLYTSSQQAQGGAFPAPAFADLTRRISGAAENVGGICFGIGLLLFLYLFFKSGYIPKSVSVLGVFASLIWTALYFANLVFPEHHAIFHYISWPLMAVADITVGFWLMLFAVKRQNLSVGRAVSG